MKRKYTINLLTIALISMFVHGCKTTYQMEVDAITNPEIDYAGDSYVLVPRDPDTDTNDLRYKETVNWIKTALSAKGMYEATDPLKADMVIEIDYGIEPPRQEFKVVEEPVYMSVRGPDEIRTVANTDPKTGKTTFYQVSVPGRVRRELAGYKERVVSVIVNEKYLEMVAVENKLEEASGDTPASEIWSVRVRNTDESDDLREYLPIMASAATDYIGEDSDSEQNVKLKEDDERVQFIKRGINEQNVVVQ
ncbi:hypothetical protein MLD52_17165 [Puniceicoccaceae bacterium K14]|nr:hypothetical protein [Puniceicoccaceae bacterium K14]